MLYILLCLSNLTFLFAGYMLSRRKESAENSAEKPETRIFDLPFTKHIADEEAIVPSESEGKHEE